MSRAGTLQHNSQQEVSEHLVGVSGNYFIIQIHSWGLVVRLLQTRASRGSSAWVWALGVI